MDMIQHTKAYIKQRFLKELKQEDGYYRYTHSLRVAGICRNIALEEGLEEEMLILAGLLHDIGYVTCKSRLDYADHGLKSAQIAEAFLKECGYDPQKTESICYGIRIHTQEDADRARPATVLEDTVSDADNIDRFDAWRFSRNLYWDGLDKLTVKQLRQLCITRTQRMADLRRLRFATDTAKRMWNKKLDLWDNFYSRLGDQMDLTLGWDPEI